ncbi:hypothetical protein ACTI_10870 [Actinoplanes sp. OR16]|nr:hypothetical protein ACTI_10870 [Actinoplanes sp. OR16]
MTDIPEARFADLYAGSGAVALEALSRGASHALLVEADGKVARVIRDNIVALRVGSLARVITGKVLQVLAGEPDGGPYDVVFADPPYAVDADEVQKVQRLLVENGWLAPDAVVVFERSRRSPLSWVDGITEERSRRYGDTTLWYGRRS